MVGVTVDALCIQKRTLGTRENSLIFRVNPHVNNSLVFETWEDFIRAIHRAFGEIDECRLY